LAVNNYRSISVLQVLSTILEWMIFNRLSNYTDRCSLVFNRTRRWLPYFIFVSRTRVFRNTIRNTGPVLWLLYPVLGCCQMLISSSVYTNNTCSNETRQCIKYCNILLTKQYKQRYIVFSTCYPCYFLVLYLFLCFPSCIWCSQSISLWLRGSLFVWLWYCIITSTCLLAYLMRCLWWIRLVNTSRLLLIISYVVSALNATKDWYLSHYH